MNYRHAFHAGNFADVFKHCLLVAALDALRAKPAPFSYIDTHAGAGRYDLSGDAPRRTGEWRDGIGRLDGVGDAPTVVASYLDRVRDGDALRSYPGSPEIALSLLRPDDRAMLCELHPKEVAALKRHYRSRPQVAVHHRDGYEALGALLPPQPRRGLALVDPPFEDSGEFDRLLGALRTAHRLWPVGVPALWYPMVHAHDVRRFRRALVASGMARILDVSLSVRERPMPGTFSGCGMVFVNPPWRLQQGLDDWLPWLASRLAAPGSAGRADWTWLGKR